MTAGSLTHSRRAAAPPCTPVQRAKQAKQRQQKPRTHKRMAGKRQAPAAQARHKSSRLPTSQEQGGTPAKKRRGTGHESHTTATGGARTVTPAGGAAHWAQKNPSEQAKFAFALLPARRGHVNRGRQKFASLFLAGTVFFCFALRTTRRAAQNKRGRRPLLSPASFLKKA